MKNFALLILILISWPKPALPQSNLSGELGDPFITNWSPKDYNAHMQNWKIVQDKRGVMYFANGSGVLEYDGVNWRTISLPNDSWALSLAFDSSAGQIYVGAENELGYLSPDSIGQLQYISLMPYLPEQYRDFGEIWETLASRQGIYFRSSKYLFRWKNDSTINEQGNFKIWKQEHSFNRAFLVRDKLYVHQGETGLMELANDSLRLVPGGERFFQERIIALLPFDNNRILTITRSQRMFLFDGQTFQPFITQADAFLQENQLYHCAMLADGTFALATLRGGLAIIDKQGRLLQIVNKISGLIDDNIKFLYPDREGALWLALNNGLSRVETTNPLSLYSEQLGIKGFVASVLRHQNRLYVATSQGVYFLSSLAGKMPIFHPVSGISAEAWSFLPVDNALLAATHQGIFRIEGDRATQRVCDLSSYCFYRSSRDSNLVYVGLDEGLGLLQLQNGKWFFSGPVQGISGDVRSIVEDEDGILWLGTSLQGVIRVKFPSRQPGVSIEKFSAVETEHFSGEKGIPIGSVRVSFIKNRVRVATYKGMRMFEPRSQSFIPDSTFGKIFADTLTGMNRIIEGYQGQVFIRLEIDGKMIIGEAIPQENGIYAWNTNPFARILEYNDVMTIYPDPEYPGVIWFGGEGTIVRYDPKVIKNYSIDYHALIRRVTVKDSVIFGGTYNNEKDKLTLLPILHYANNSLRFEFAAPYYDGQNAIQYQVFLEGFDKTWSEWTNETKKDYTNLSEGEYHFRVRAKNLYNHLSHEAVYSFKILPPWWFTWWAYSLYLAGFVVLLGGIRKFELDRRKEKETKKFLQLENDRKTKELEEARQLQLSMLPKALPKLPDLDIAVYMKTATEVGGDYYDFNVGLDSTLTVAIGDATGHGMKAGTIVSMVKALFASGGSRLEMKTFFDQSSNVLKEIELGRLMMAFMMIKKKSYKIEIANAGMPPLFIYRKQSSTVEEIMINGMPLGAIKNFPYEIKELEIASGDTILLLSDGLPELKNKKNEQYDYERVKQEFKNSAEKSPEEIVEHLKNSASEWINGTEPDDDVTFVVIKVK